MATRKGTIKPVAKQAKFISNNPGATSLPGIKAKTVQPQERQSNRGVASASNPIG
jgi:hypothetical protein